MAIQATFSADFTPFISGVNDAKQSLGELVGRALGTAAAMDTAFADTRSIGQRFRDLKADIAPHLDNIKKQLEDTGKQLKAVGDQASNVGMALSKITAPFGVASVAAGKFAADFQTGLTQLVNIAGETEDKVGGIKQAILDLAPAVGIGPQKLLDAMIVVESTGIRGKKAMEILQASAKASAAGLGNVEDIARTVTAAITAYGQENISADKAVEILFKAVREGGANAKEVAGTLGRVIGIAKELGVPFEEVATFIATYTRLGVNASEAVTSVRGVFTTLLKPSAEAKKTLAELGTSAEELRQTVKEKGLTQALQELMEKTKGDDEALAKIIPNVRALAGVLGTAGSQGTEMSGVLQILKTDSDDLGVAFKKVQDTTNWKWASLIAEVDKVAIEFGDTLAPALGKMLEAAKPILGAIESLVKWFGDLPLPIQTLGIAFGAFTAIIGPAVFIVGQLVSAFGTIVTAIGAVVGSEGFAAFLAGLATLAGPIAIAVAAVVGLGLIWYEFGDTIKEALSKAVARIQEWDEKVKPMFTAVGDLLTSVGKLFQAFGKVVGAVGGLVVSYVTQISEAIILWLVDKLRPIWGPLAKAFTAMSDGIHAAKDAIVKFAEQIYEGVYLNLVSKFVSIVKGVQEKIDSVTGFFEKLYDKVIKHSYVPDMIEGIADEFAKLDAVMVAPAKTSADQVNHIFEDLGKNVGPATRDALGRFTKNVLTLGQELTQVAEDIPHILEKAFTGGGGLEGAVKALGARLGGAFSKSLEDSLKKNLAGGTLLSSESLEAAAGIGAVTGGASVASGASGSEALRNVALSAAGVMASATAASVAAGTMTTAAIVGTVALGAATLGIGAAAVGVALLAKHFFSVSQEVKDARTSVTKFTEAFDKTITATEKAATGGDKLRGELLHLQDAYIALGFDAEISSKKAQQQWAAMIAAQERGPAAVAAAMQPIAQALQDAAVATANVNKGFATLMTAAAGIHGVLTPELRAATLQLADMKGLTDEEKTALLALADDTKPKFEELIGIAKTYGIGLSDLGPQFQQANIDGMATKIFSDFQLLTSAGADVGGVLHGMSDEINQLVLDARRFGSSIPVAMRPLIEELFNTGQLTDENGNKLETLSGITFADTPLQTSLNTLTDALNHLSEIIGQLPGVAGTAAAGIADAFNKIPKQITTEIVTTHRDFYEGGDNAGDTGQQMHLGGLVAKYHAGTAKVLPFRVVQAHAGMAPDEVPAILQTGEAVLNRSATKILGPDVIKALNRGSGGGAGAGSGAMIDLTPVVSEVGNLRRDLAMRDRLLPKLIRDAILTRSA